MITVSPKMYGYGQYTDYMLYLYEQTSKAILPASINAPNSAWLPYIDAVYKALGFPIPEVKYTHCIDKAPNKSYDNNEVVLAFSGGKDSCASALALKDNGVKCVLFNLKGLNRSYRHEDTVCQEFASFIGMPLIARKMEQTGKCELCVQNSVFTESPVKNHLILAMMIDYMIENNNRFATLGVFTDDKLDEIVANLGLSDAIELFYLFQDAVNATFKEFRFFNIFQSTLHAKAFIFKYHDEVIPPITQSCLLPDRYRANNARLHEAKWGIKLKPNRCLSCWKCCDEMYLFQKFGIYPHNQTIIDNAIIPKLREELRKSYKLPSGISEKDLSNDDILNMYINQNTLNRYLNNPDEIKTDMDLSTIAHLIGTYHYPKDSIL